MVNSILKLSIVLLVVLVSCNKDDPEEYTPIETCLEGWVSSEDGEGIFYQKCPERLNECIKSFRIEINVFKIWSEGPGVLIIRNIGKNKSEEFRWEQQIYNHRFNVRMSYDQFQKYSHEVTLELPTQNCDVNGVKGAYTFAFELPCDGYVNLKFDICTK